MKPKGFKGKYFNLNAIQAYSSALKLAKQKSRTLLFQTLHHPKEQDGSIEDPPPDEALLTLPFITIKKPVRRCNCYFDHLTRLKLHTFFYIPRCPYYNTYFAFRRSGVHPPFLSF